jgi:hypothetical protein
MVKSDQKNDFFQVRPGRADARRLAVEVCCCILKELETSKVRAPAVLEDEEVMGREERDAAFKNSRTSSLTIFGKSFALLQPIDAALKRYVTVVALRTKFRKENGI